MIDGLHVSHDAEGVVVRTATPLLAVSSAVAGGGIGPAAAIVNVHVTKHGSLEAARATLEAFVRRRGVPTPYVGLLTGAATEKAEVEVARHRGLAALAVVTVGLSNRVTAGVSPAVAAAPASTINTIVVVDADAEHAALVNAVITVTEVKTLALVEAGVTGAGGRVATGTSTDAVVIAATGRGARERFGGPVSDVGWVVAQAAGPALRRGIARWQAERADA